MEIRYNRTGAERKALVMAVSEITGGKAVYRKAPTFAYAVGGIVIHADGAMVFDEGMSKEEACGLMSALEERGFAAAEFFGMEEESGPAGEDPPGAKPAGDSPIGGAPDILAIELSLAGFTEAALSNLEQIIGSKAALLRKSLGVTALPVERLEDRLRFPWLSPDAPPGKVSACSQLVAKLCDMAKFQKRVTARERPVDNEKYAMRCFLLRLGFIGAGYGPARKLLLAGMSGDGSFKGGKSGDRRDPTSAVPAADGPPGGREPDQLVRGGLCMVPPTDCNYASYLREATDAQLREAVAFMEAAPGGHKGRIAVCKRELKKRGAANVPTAAAPDACL